MRSNMILIEGICERAKQIIDSAEFPTNIDMLEKFISELEEDVYKIYYERDVLDEGRTEERVITIVFANCDLSMIICGNGERKSRGNYSINVRDNRPFRYVKTENDGLWKDEIIA